MADDFNMARLGCFWTLRFCLRGDGRKTIHNISGRVKYSGVESQTQETETLIIAAIGRKCR